MSVVNKDRDVVLDIDDLLHMVRKINDIGSKFWDDKVIRGS